MRAHLKLEGASLLLLLRSLAAVSAGCTDGGGGGCSPPVGEKWDRWDMAGSTYTYCYNNCVMPWLLNNTKPLGLGEFGGVVGVDHYWTGQGTPCVGGQPQEFAMQDALTLKWKAAFPTMRFLQYRILSAVPYDMVVQNKILSDPTSVVRWQHEPDDTTRKDQKCPASGCKQGGVCYNYISGCFNDKTRINNPAHNCSFEIRAAAYNWSNPALADWFQDEVIAPALVHADGIWLDGIGPDNGAYMCSGVCCGFGAKNSPLDQAQIDGHCKAQSEATTQVQKYLIKNQGWEAQKCFDYKGGSKLPNSKDSPAACSSKLQKWAAFGADHKNYNFVVAYGSRTGGQDAYSDETVHGTVAAFMLMRGQHWLFSISANHGHRPFGGTMEPATAKLLTSDYGRPKGNMTAVVGKSGVFKREYEKATVSLDCNTFQGSFDEH